MDRGHDGALAAFKRESKVKQKSRKARRGQAMMSDAGLTFAALVIPSGAETYAASIHLDYAGHYSTLPHLRRTSFTIGKTMVTAKTTRLTFRIVPGGRIAGMYSTVGVE